MDKKDKILLLLAPVAVVVVVYTFFGDQLFPKEVEKPKEESFTTIDAPVTELRKNRTEIYRDKYEKENGIARERNIKSDESFFGEEEIKDEENSVYKNVESEEVIEEVKPVEKVEQKQKAIVNNVERPTKKKAEYKEEPVQVPQVVESKPARRRTGFVEGSNKTSEVTKTTTTDEAAEEVMISSVVQDNVEVKTGNYITLRTIEQVTVNGTVIPKNTLITGVVNLTTQRLNLNVTAIKTPTKTIQVKLKGYDLDGNEGVPLEGGVDKEIKRDVINDAITAGRTIVKVPILSSTPSRIGTKKVNDPTSPIPKGLKVILKP